MSYSYAQTLNSYLIGIWKMECCSDYFNIFHENTIYTISNNKEGTGVKIFYCIPRVLTYTEDESGRKRYKKSIPIDSVQFDQVLKPDPETGEDLVYLLEYEEPDIINKKEILVTDTPPSLSFYHIDPQEKNQFYVWDGTAPSKIVYYNRILNPPVYVLEFFKKIAPERFRRIAKSRCYIMDDFKKATKMYLIQGDTVEITAEESFWYHIRFYGPKKTIEGWIKKSDVE